MAAKMLASRNVPITSSFRGAAVPAKLSSPSSRVVLARADGPRVTSGREYREDGNGQGKMVEKSAPAEAAGQSPEGAIYADPTGQPPQIKNKPSMSKEMKAKLKEEYTGFGGSANKAMGNNYFLWIIAIVATLAVASHFIGAI